MRLLSQHLALFIACLLLCGCHVTRGYEAALLLADIASGRQPSRLKKVTPDPSQHEIAYTALGEKGRGDLYLPGETPLAGILLLPGAAENGKDDPRLRAFATSLARARFTVLVPDLEGFRSLRVGSRDIGETAAAFAWFVSRPDLVPGGRGGICSFSYASGPAILAALDKRISGRVRFMMIIGGYYDLADVLVFFTTGYYRENGALRHREPNRYGTWAFVASNLERIGNPSDRRLLRIAAQRKMEDLDAPVEDLAEDLGPEGRSLYRFIDNRDPARATLLMEKLPGPIRKEIELLNIANRDLTALKSRMILIHGYDDDIIPFTESIALARALPPDRRTLCLVRGLMHVDLEPRLADTYRLWRAISALLRERG